MFCSDIIKTTWFIFSSDTPTLLYYSHIPTAIAAVFLGIFVFLNNKESISGRIFLMLNISYGVLIFLNLILWTNSYIPIITFVWPITQILFVVVPILSLYFFCVFIKKRDVGLFYKIIWSLIVLFLIVLAFSKLNFSSFSATLCEPILSRVLFIYQNIVFVLIFISLITFFIRNLLQKSFKEEHKKSVLLFVGIFLFLIFFTVTWQIAESYDYFSTEQYGLFGMTVLLAIMSFLIVRFKAFDIKLIGSQALVWALVILVGSEFFFVNNLTSQFLVGITLVLSAITGLIIVRSVKREIMQKERIERLATSLESSNEKLEEANAKLKELDSMKSEFVSLATHQIRSPLAAIKGYVSLMEEGDYGEVPETFKEPLDTVFKSTDSLSKMVTDFLDVSRLDLGQMKYEFSDFDFRDLANEVVKELSPGIKAKGLDLRIKITDSPCSIKADRVKLKQVLNNLVDNSAKYTKQGFMEISVENKGGKTLFAVKDSGVGISEKTMAVLFQRFSRAKNANEVNILGTGLGLYVAKKMTEANNGRVWAESAGEGKGAQFYVELPLRS